MNEQELRNYFGDRYPTSLVYQRRLKERLELFPGALEVYQPDKQSLIHDRNSWFLVSQLMPELVIDYGSSPDRHLEDFIGSDRAHTADWTSVYKFFDLYMQDGDEYGDELVNILTRHRDELLNSYDIV